ncbi:MAG: bile acid:sodium symporter family protein [Bacteroidales bacterium]|nr:bile acid:sodium symporter family protein [Bacteroidales bacterium]
MFQSLEVLDNIRLNFSPEGLFAMNITLAFIMFGVALDIKKENFVSVIKNPKIPLIGMISQFLLLPAITYLLVRILNLTPSIALGMILVAACPGGNISNFISSLAKADVALSVSLTAVATLISIFMTPFNFAFWGHLYIKSSPLLRPITIDPYQMFQTVFILLGIPLVLGLAFANKFPNTTKMIIKPIKIASIFAFFGFVVGALAANFDHFMNYIGLIIFIVILHNALAILTGYTVSRIFKLPQIDRRTIAIETGIQNSGLALVLIFNPKIFPADLHLGGMAFIAAGWGIWHIISGMGLAFFWSKRKIILN